MNIERRHLTEAQECASLFALDAGIREEVKEKQRKAGKTVGSKNLVQNQSTSLQPAGRKLVDSPNRKATD